jgi:1,4-dihydroxy-2-naphthoate polyprenyltransferase
LLVYHSPWQFLFMLAIPLFLRNGMAIATKPSEKLDPYLRQMAMSALLFVVLFGTGHIVA